KQLPSSSLSTYINCYCMWQSHELVLPVTPFKVIPSGHLEILFSFGMPSKLPGIPLPQNVAAVQVYLIGPRETSLTGSHAGYLDMLLVRFNIGYGTIFTQHALQDFSGLNLVLDPLLRPDQVALVEQMASTSDMHQRIALFEDWLRQALQRRVIFNGHVLQALAMIDDSQGSLSINQLTQALGVTRRHLARQFAVHVGLSPKQLAQVVRLRYVLALLEQPYIDWIDIANICGFYDQSHFIHNYKAIFGMTPEKYRHTSTDVPFLQYNMPSL
ncbi:MAG: helix-turn-helix transcriptional regulator, partial [Chloroflexota bacterium]